MIKGKDKLFRVIVCFSDQDFHKEFTLQDLVKFDGKLDDFIKKSFSDIGEEIIKKLKFKQITIS